jgi:hypothetical protein
MTREGNGQVTPYQMSMSQQKEAVLKDLHEQAIQAGTGLQFFAAFRQIAERLHTDPFVFGEPQYRLPVLKLQVRQAIVAPLVVDYAVHEEQPLVFIRGFKVLA